jgi:hypothetical protein
MYTSYVLYSAFRSPERGSHNAIFDDIKRNIDTTQTRSKNVKQEMA